MEKLLAHVIIEAFTHFEGLNILLFDVQIKITSLYFNLELKLIVKIPKRFTFRALHNLSSFALVINNRNEVS
jgi:hypothetical protein